MTTTTTTSGTSPMLDALARRPTPRTPVWLMRQAGRYLPEYQEVRKKSGGFLAMAKNPELAAEVTLQPVRRFDVDAAVIFSDILLPLEAMGMELRFEEGRGPVLPSPLRGPQDVGALRIPNPEAELGYVGESLKLVGAELRDDQVLIGFAGLPFTLAAYAVEGGAPGPAATLRTLMYRHTDTFELLMKKLAATVAAHLAYQVKCGARMLVLFDTWAGQLAADDYKMFVAPWTRIVLQAVAGSVPRMVFVRGGGHLLDDVVAEGPEAIALDWRVPIGQAFERWGDKVAIQGNLDPAALLCSPDEVRHRARAILRAVDGRPGHILSLGHGVMKQTDPEAVAAFVAAAKQGR